MLRLSQLIGFGAGGAPPEPLSITVSTNTAGTSHTVNMPATVNAGDLLLVVFAHDWDAGITWGGTGFTEFFDQVSANISELAFAYKQADGTEGGGSITVTTVFSDESGAAVYRIINAANPAVQAPEASTGATGNNPNPDPDSITPTGGPKQFLWIAAYASNASIVTGNSAYPTGYVDGQDLKITGMAGGSAHKVSIGSSENPGTFTHDGNAPFEEWIAATIAVHPA